jgi:hypothetical protein
MRSRNGAHYRGVYAKVEQITVWGVKHCQSLSIIVKSF